MLCEHLKWKAGRSAEAIRTMATTSLFMLLPRQIPEKLLPILLSLVEDASPKTRQLALACIAKCSFLTGLHASDIFSKIITGEWKVLRYKIKIEIQNLLLYHKLELALASQ